MKSGASMANSTAEVPVASVLKRDHEAGDFLFFCMARRMPNPACKNRKRPEQPKDAAS
jgi:hypothetical protein